MNKHSYRACLFFLALASVVACDSSDDDDDDEGQDGGHDGGHDGDGGHDEGDHHDASTSDASTEGAFECCVLGEICHDVEDEGGPLAGCHDLGHENDGAKCIADYERCRTACIAAGASEEIPAMCKE